MTDLLAVGELYAYLIDQGVAQPLDAAPSLTVPSIVIQPRLGAPEPRQVDGAWVEDATITLTDTGLGSPSNLEPWMEEAFIEVVVRARSQSRAQLVHRTIRGLLAPGDGPGGRKLWQMGALLVEYSDLWRREQPLPTPNDGRTYDRTQTFRIGARVKSLQGLPYEP